MDELLKGGYEVVAVVRRPDIAALLLPDHVGRVTIATRDDLEATGGQGALAIVNLAYVKSAPPHRVRSENRALIESVHRLAQLQSCPHVVQVSTLAVFGYGFTRQPVPEPAPVLKGNLYIETKAQAERWLVRRAVRYGYQLSIVRLGNVIGPAQPAWTGNLAQRLLEGRPVGYLGRLGFSNTTYAGNAAAYIRSLVKQTTETSTWPVRYHHVAEFAHHTWEEYIAAVENAIGVQRVMTSIPESARGTWVRPIVRAMRRTYRGVTGTYARALLGRLPAWWLFDWFLARLKTSDLGAHWEVRSDVGDDDATLYEILSSSVAVRPHVLENWVPRITWDVAMNEIGAWLGDAGYLVRRDA
jgi:nucleoside-diphosphate-sugar epimerase